MGRCHSKTAAFVDTETYSRRTLDDASNGGRHASRSSQGEPSHSAPRVSQDSASQAGTATRSSSLVSILKKPASIFSAHSSSKDPAWGSTPSSRSVVGGTATSLPTSPKASLGVRYTDSRAARREGDEEVEDDDEEEDEEEEEEEDDDILENGEGGLDGHSGRVLAPVKRTTKLQVGVIEGTTFLNQYVIVDTLGRGTFGTVKLCLNTVDDNLYAVKAVNKKLLRRRAAGGRGGGRDPVEDLKREVGVMRALDHPNLIKLKEVIEDKKGGKVLLVMEYGSGGALVGQDQLTPEHHMPEPLAQYYFKQIVAGLAYLHENQVVHGDLKPENVLLAGDCSLKIADFGQSQFFQKKDTFKRTLGTPAFLPPEVCAGGAFHGRRADMWALGVSLYLFVYGQTPFKGNTVADLYEVIADGRVEYPSYVTPSNPLQDLMQRLLERDPGKRMTAAEVLQHPWITGPQLTALVLNLNPGADGGGRVDSEESSLGSADTLQDWVHMIFPEIQRGNGIKDPGPGDPLKALGRRRTLPLLGEGGPFPFLDLLASAAHRSRAALRVRNASRLRTLGRASMVDSMAGDSWRDLSTTSAGGGGGSVAVLRPSHSCTSSFNQGSWREGGGGAAREAHHGGTVAGGRHVVPDAAAGDPPEEQGSGEGASGGGDDVAEEGGGAVGAGDPGSDEGRDLATPQPPSHPGEHKHSPPLHSLQSAPAATQTSPFQKVLQTAAALKQQQRSAGWRGSTASSAGTERRHRRGESRGSEAQDPSPGGEGDGGRGSDSEDGGLGAELASQSTADRLTTQVFEQIVDMMQRGELAQQAQHGGREKPGKGSPPAPLSPVTILPPPSGTPQGGVLIPQLATEGSALSAIAEEDPTLQMSMGSQGPPPQGAATGGPPSADLPPPAVAEMSGQGGAPTAPLAVPPPSRHHGSFLGDGSHSSMASPSSFSTASFSTSMHPSFSGPFASPFTQEGPASLEHTWSIPPPPIPAPRAAAGSGAPPAMAAAKADGGGGIPRLAVTAREGGEGTGERQLLPPRGAQGWVDPKTGFYMGRNPLEQSKPPLPQKRSSVQGVTEVLSTLFPLGKNSSMSKQKPVDTSRGKFPAIQIMEFSPGELMATYMGGESPVLAYIESGYVQLNYQADIPVPLSTMAALATDLMPEGEEVGDGPGEGGAGAGPSAGGSQRAQHEPSMSVLQSMEMAGVLLGADDTLDSLAYGSPLVDVASALDRTSGRPPSVAGSGLGGGGGGGGGAPQMQRADTLMVTVQKATHRAEQLLKNATVGGSIDELLVSVRGPQEFLGALVALDPDFVGGRWKMHVVARTQVRAVVMTKEGLATFLEQNPLAQVHLRAGLSQARSDVMRLEAMEKLALAGEQRSHKQMAGSSVTAAASAEEEASRRRRSFLEETADAGSWVGGRVAAGVATLGEGVVEGVTALAENVAEGVAEGVASLGVFGVVAKLRAALQVSEGG